MNKESRINYIEEKILGERIFSNNIFYQDKYKIQETAETSKFQITTSIENILKPDFCEIYNLK